MTWKILHHKNVLPLLGVTMSQNQFVMLSEWMVNGNINEFVKVHRDVDLFELVGPSLYCKLPLLILFDPYSSKMPLRG